MKTLSNIIIFLIFITAFNVSPKNADALTKLTPTNTNIQQQVDDLKNKIASKVAELKLVEKRGIIAFVSDTSDTQITLTDLKGDTRFVDVDELTKFFSSSSKTFGISDIKKGMTLGVLGLYNKQSRRILAREVNEIPTPSKVIFGGIGAIDNKNFEITVVKENGQKSVVGIESLTKSYAYSSGTLNKSGFSKLQKSQTILVIGFPDKQDQSKMLAERLIVFTDIDISSKINLDASLIPTIPPSTGSGKKLYPIIK